MNHGGAAKTAFGRVKLTAAIHSSSMPDGSYGGNPCGFVIETSDGNFYYSGDTALTLDMKLIGEAHQTAASPSCPSAISSPWESTTPSARPIWSA